MGGLTPGEPAVRHARSGRSRTGRLRALDIWLSRREVALVKAWAGAAWAMDVGLGDSPDSTLAWLESLQAVDARARVLAVDADPARVNAARRLADGQLECRAGHFTALREGERAFLVRAMNVLRGYPREEVGPAVRHLATGLVEGGLLVEGSTDREGHLACAHLFRQGSAGLRHEALLFHTDFTRGFSPWMFRDVLPRDLRRDVRPGTPIHDFFSAWTAAWESCRAGASSPAEAFVRSVAQLGERLAGVDTETWALENGYLRWMPKSASACVGAAPCPDVGPRTG